ncbi:MAG TPA: glycosyltransferase, partial [Solirubrobacteraceae bacterium]|nr:glycosyltransferase [Solirubrobacteraceae bacterium]
MRRPGTRPRILLVAMANSVHTARWIGQLDDEGWDVHLFPVSHRPLHSDLRNVTVHTPVRRPRPDLDISVRQRGIRWPLPRGSVRLEWTLERMSWTNRAARLARAVSRLRPDIVHSLEMQHSAYLTLESRRLLGGENFPPWIYSCWGSDVYYFGRQPDHVERVEAVLSACDYLTTDCERDRHLAAEHGFRGTFLGVFPGPGGFQIDRMRRMRCSPPASSRRVIALKGYHDDLWVGRALVALEAIHRLSASLTEYEVVIYSAEDNVRHAADYISRTTGLRLTVLPESPPDEIVALMGRARIAIGVNISDGVPNSMLEAMIMGALPIQSDTISTQEWITDGENGLLVAPEDPDDVERALRRALVDDELVDRADRLNRRLTDERIAYPVVAPRVVEAYRRVLREADEKVAFMSEYLPPAPTWSGQASVLSRLLADVDPKSYCLLSRVDFDAPEYRSAPRRLPARYHHLGDAVMRSPERARGLERWGIRARRGWSMLRAVARGAVAVRRERCGALVAAPDRVEDLPIALAISRLAGARFYPYLFDDYATKWTRPREARFARRVEPYLLRRAAGVIVPNEYLGDDLRRRHGVASTVVRNPCDLVAYESHRRAEVDDLRRPAAVVFTGAVYHAHYGAFANLLEAIGILGPQAARLHLYTASDPELLARHGLIGPIDFHRHAPATAMPRIQQEAQVLFLPLAFDSPYPDVV